MKTIRMYSVSTQGNDGNTAKGTSSNPYTQEEFDSMLDGGYVEGMGYVFPEVEVNGSSSNSPDFGSDSWIDPWGSTSTPWGNSGEDLPSQPSGGDGAGNNNGGNQGGGNNSGNGGGSSNTNTNVSDILPKSAFRGYLSSDSRGCLNRCREMLAIANCQLNNKEIVMTHYDSNGRATIATNNFKNGLNYIDGQLQQNKPVIVAVDYKEKTSMGGTRLDQAGDHFVIIVGGCPTNGYHYYDPATQYQERGTSLDNIFKMDGDLMKSTNTCTGSIHNYILTSIRENK